MVKIRLSRRGRKNYATYKLVVTPAREKRDSKAIEFLGHYNPHTKDLVVEKERTEYWLGVGAQPSDTVRRLLVKKGILKNEEKKKTFKKEAGKKSVERAAAKAEKASEKSKPAEEKEVVEEAAA